MQKTSDFKDLFVWQQSMDLAKKIYNIVRKFPIEEKYGLGDQLRRCAIFIPSNIAEGQSRDSDREFLHFLSIARGSASELETQLLLTNDLNLSDENTIEEILLQVRYINIMIRSLRNSIIERMNKSSSSPASQSSTIPKPE